MGSCATIRGMLTGYLEKDLSAHDERQVKDHLAVCLPCRRVFQQAELIKDRLNSMESLTLSPTFNEDLQRRIAHSSEEEKSLFNIKKVSWSLSGVAVVVSAYFMFTLFFPSEKINTQQPATAAPSLSPATVISNENDSKVKETIAREIKKAQQVENSLQIPAKGDTATHSVKSVATPNINLIEEKK